MCHGFVKEVFGKGLGVVGRERRDHDNHHLTNNRIAVRPETENLVGSIEEVLLHKLRVFTMRTKQNIKHDLVYHACMQQ